MVRLTARQFGALGETVGELANYGAAALVFGQFVGQGAVSWRVVLTGIAIWVALVSLALVVEGE